jgi:proteasome lid subunit RPN8/RPN11
VASRFHLPYREFRRLHRRARHAQQRDHGEVVGLLSTRDSGHGALALTFLPNRAQGSGRWEVDLSDLTRLRKELRAQGSRVVGLFHSHPLGYATLGPNDRRSTPTGWMHLVYDVCGLEPRLFSVRRVKGRRRVVMLTVTVQRSQRRRPRSRSVRRVIRCFTVRGCAGALDAVQVRRGGVAIDRHVRWIQPTPFPNGGQPERFLGSGSV